MKFNCEKSVLLKEISIAQEIIASKNAISILSNVLMVAENDTLFIKATDLKVNFETRIPVNVIEAGSTTIFCDKLQGILNSIPDGEIEFEQKDTKLIIKPALKKIKFQLKSIASDKFPEFPASHETAFFDIPVKEFKEMIVQTVFAVSDDETRYFMNGVFLENNENKLVMVATDGRRLAYIEKEFQTVIPPITGIIIPPKILTLITRRAGDEGSISIGISSKYIFIKFGSYFVSSVLIEGKFPVYQKVIPEKQDNSLSFNRLDCIEALKRVSLLVEQKSRRIYLMASPGTISISSEETEMGTAKEDIPCRYDGEDITIALNYRYLEEPLKVISEENISIKFSDTNKAITLTSVPERSFLHIIMPMQTD